MRLQLPLFAVLVEGPSMAPTLRSGDALVVRRTRRVREGELTPALAAQQILDAVDDNREAGS